MKAVDHKGRLVCIETLKAKAAIMFRFCMIKAQRGFTEEGRRKEGKATIEE